VNSTSHTPERSRHPTMPSNAGVSVQGSGSAEIVVHPANYYDVPELQLAYGGKTEPRASTSKKGRSKS